jgi:hypothetical protein
MKDDKVVHLGRKKNAFEDELLENCSASFAG